MNIEQITGACGAEISGVNLARLSNSEFDSIHTALLDHGVVFFRDQNISLDEQVAFAGRFGPETSGKGDLFIERNILVAEKHHAVVEQGSVNAVKLGIGQSCQINARYLCATRAGNLLDIHDHSPITSAEFFSKYH